MFNGTDPYSITHDVYGKDAGACITCTSGFVKTAGSAGSIFEMCTAHAVCENDEWSDPLDTVDAATDRECQTHSECTAGFYEAAAGTATTDTACIALKVCEITEYTSAAPTSTSNRGCTAYSAECLLGTTYESVAKGESNDRQCSSVDICTQVTDVADKVYYPGLYMLTAPTKTDNTVCAALTTCNYTIEEITTPTEDSATFSTPVYAANRDCVARKTCVEPYETTDRTAFATTCSEVATTTAVFTWEWADLNSGTSAAACDLVTAAITDNAGWETYLTTGGTDGVADQDPFNTGDFTDSSLMVKVAGTGSDYTGAVELDSTSDCTFSVKYFFVPKTGTRKQRRSSAARPRRGSLPAPSVEVLPAGTGLCSIDKSKKCCKKGYGSSGGGCNECEAMTYQDTSSTLVSDSNDACLDQPACNFATEYYANQAPSTQAQVSDNCLPLSSCGKIGKVANALSNDGQDRTCTTEDLVFCTDAQFWADATQMTGGGNYEYEKQPECSTLADCPATHVWTNSESSTLEAYAYVGDETFSYLPFFIEDRDCEARASCVSGEQFATNYDTVPTVGLNNVADYNCQDFQECADDEYEVFAGSISVDVGCKETDTCDSTSEFESTEPTPGKTNRGCQQISTCEEDVQWQSKAPTDTSNRECLPITPCQANQVVLEPATATSDQTCWIPGSPTAAPTAAPTAVPTVAM